MFKNAIAFRIGSAFAAPSLVSLEEALQRQKFVPCGPTTVVTSGWVPPRDEEHGALAVSVDGHIILKLQVEKKVVPAGAVKQELELRVKAIEDETGRKPGPKKRKLMKEEIIHEMLPRAFTKRTSNLVWIDPKGKFLVVGSGSRNGADAVLNHLVNLFDGLGLAFPVGLVHTVMSPSAAMSLWLSTQEAPTAFSLDRECELKLPDQEQSVVRYSRHSLELDEIARHIKEGKTPTKLAMTWNGKASFMLTTDMSLKKLEFLDFTAAGVQESDFETDVALATGTLSGLLVDLIEALGGEQEIAETQPEPDVDD